MRISDWSSDVCSSDLHLIEITIADDRQQWSEDFLALDLGVVRNIVEQRRLDEAVIFRSFAAEQHACAALRRVAEQAVDALRVAFVDDARETVALQLLGLGLAVTGLECRDALGDERVLDALVHIDVIGCDAGLADRKSTRLNSSH